MISALLVDDEIRTVRGLADSIPWTDLGVDSVTTATDGAAALAIVSDRPIDIIVTDIRMPRMDGIEFARKAAAVRPESVIVFLTALSQFDLAKAALSVRALDYILKPVDTGEVIDVVTNAVADVHRRRSLAATNHRDQAFIVNALRELLAGRTPDSDAWSIFPGRANVFGAIGIRQLGTSAELSCSTLATALAERLDTKIAQRVVVDVCADTALLCWIGSFEDRTGWADDALVDTQRLIDRLEMDDPSSVLAAGVAVGASSPEEALATMRAALVVAECALTHESRRVFRVVEDPPDASAEWENVRQRFDACLASDPVTTTHELDAILSVLDRKNWFRLQHRDEVRRYCAALLVSASASSGTRRGRELVSMAAQVESCSVLHELRRTISDIAQAVIRPGGADPGGSPIVRRICEYVDATLDRPITLAAVAAHAELSPSYVSTLFRRETGESLVRFVAGRKVEQAKRLFDAQSHLPVSEVAERLGFSDYRYFTRVFKRITGMTPTEFVRRERGPS